MPVIVRDLDDDAAVILMVDSNLQRETLLPSEKAFAFKMKLEAMKRQGARTDLTSTQVVSKLSADEVGESSGISRETVRRYIRLTELIPELLDMVDNKKIAFNPAVELSYLTKDEQNNFLEAMEYAQATPSLSQAQRLKKFSQEGRCSFDVMCAILSEKKKDEQYKLVFKKEEIEPYFPSTFTPQQMQETVIRLLKHWKLNRDRDAR